MRGEPAACQALAAAEAKPGIYLASGDALVRVDGEHLANEILGAVRDVAPVAVVELVRPVLDLPEQLLLVGVPEGRVPAEEDVHNDTRGPDIHGVLVRFPPDDLGCDVAGGPAPARKRT
eukprot:scaffold405_cov243-Pinguiococcus_pyrenoidosus.AAC.7